MGQHGPFLWITPLIIVLVIFAYTNFYSLRYYDTSLRFYEKASERMNEQRIKLEVSLSLPLSNATIDNVTMLIPQHEQTDEEKIQQIVNMMNQLTKRQQENIFDQLIGREFPYKLTCPKSTIDIIGNYSVIVSYHVGMMNNWISLVRDQLHIIHSCGLASVMTHMFITYSNNDTTSDDNRTLEYLQSLVRIYDFYDLVTFKYSYGQPLEGTAINMLRNQCIVEHDKYVEESEQLKQQQLQLQQQSNDITTTNNNNTIMIPEEKKIIGFYFHTKGSSRFVSNWNEPSMNKPWTYSRALYWRKYMEYYTIERPEICIDYIINKNADACGVYALPKRKMFGGNFWAISCEYAIALSQLEIGTATNKSMYWNGEGWFSMTPERFNSTRFIGLSSPKGGLYSYLIDPKDYSDYSTRWKL